MVKLILFSRDRACQLHCLLSSLEKNLPGLFEVSCIYVTSNKNYAAAYRIVKEDFVGVDFIYEGDFQKDVIREVQRSEHDHIAFSTDDMVIYRSWPSNADYFDFLPDSPAITSSLRLGLNTTVQDCHNSIMQPALNIYTNRGAFIEWDSHIYHPLSNYGYPYSVDLHIFQKERILGLISLFSWNNSNQLESGLQQYRGLVRYIRSLPVSLAVNIPTNNLSGVTQTNRQGGLSCETLNEKFLEGKRIDLSAIETTDIRGCHQDLELRLI